MLLRSILVGLDGSAFSQSAIELAIRWSKRFNCSVTGVGIVDEPTIRAPRFQPPPPDIIEEALEQEKQQVDLLMDQFTFRCKEAGVLDFQKLVDTGIAYKQLTIEAQRFDIVLLGQRTYFRHHTYLTDDETIEMLTRHCPRPIVAVPKKLAGGAGIMIAYDGDSQASRAVQALVATGICANTDVWVLSVSNSMGESSEIAGRAVEYLNSHDIAASPVPIAPKQQTAKTIVEEAQKHGAELIVMGAYGRSAIRELFLGSVTQKLLEESPLPIFLYH